MHTENSRIHYVIVRQTESNFDLAERLNRFLLPGNPGSNLILVTETETHFVLLDEARKLPRIQQYDLAVHVVI
jgi:hypothetical protein